MDQQMKKILTTLLSGAVLSFALTMNAQAALNGGLSQTELETKQLEIDAALDSIDMLVSSTTFGGNEPVI